MTSPSPTSAVDICNIALGHIGERRITSIESPKDDREETMATLYSHVRRVCLREYVWNFAQAYAVLARTGDGLGQHEDRYQLPAECVRVNIVGQYVEDPIQEFDIYGRELHASSGNQLHLRYNKDVDEVAEMDALFIEVFALRLALAAAYPLSKKKSVVDMVNGLLSIAESKAASVDGQERPPRRVQRSKYLSARRGYGTSFGRDNRYYNIS